MVTKLGILTATLFTSIAFGQPSPVQGLDRTFHFSHTETAQEIQEITTVVKGVTGIDLVSADTDQKLLAVHGTSDEIAVTAWLMNELDRTVTPQSGQNLTDHKYLMPGVDPDNVVRVFLLTNAESVQHLQEVATLVRSIGDIRRAFTYNHRRAMVLRGSPGQIALAEWLVNNLDTPAGVASAAPQKYVMAAGGNRDDVVRVFHLTHTDSVQNLQELATLVRSIGEIRRVFTYNSSRVVAMRGSAEQIGLAEWMMSELDPPVDVKITSKREYTVAGPGDPDNVVRIFALTHASTVQRLQEVAVQVRTMTRVRRIFTYGAPRVIALRGTPGQVEQADQLIKEWDR